MVTPSPVPVDSPVLPPPLVTSLLIKDNLSPQRQIIRDQLFDALDLSQQYYKNGEHRLVTVELAKWAIRQTDHTTLRTNRNEPPDFMMRMLHEATRPYEMRSITTWPDFEDSPYSNKLTALLEGLQRFPNVGITLVLGYPHGFTSPDEAKRAIDTVGKKLRDVKNPKDIDTVMRYPAWMSGDHALVKAILKAEGEAARDNGLTWKSIQKVSVHAKADENKVYGADFIRSVYDSTRLALEAGAHFAKTSTGVSAEPPFNYFAQKDTGIIIRALPMLVAIADFNRETGQQRLPKFSGGNTNEADAAVAKLASERILGADLAEKIVFGTSYRYRRQLCEFIVKMTHPNCPFDRDLLKPYGFDVEEIATARRGVWVPGNALSAPDNAMVA